ncbi:MAG: DMT family transporter [Pseudobdellovibrio sp.]
MTLYLFLPFITGVSIIMQAGLNRQTSMQIGLLSAVLLNSFIFFSMSLFIWILVRKEWIQVPAAFQIKDFSMIQPWYLIPGILGFFIVLCMPLALRSMPAALAFGVSISTQLIVSVIWDYFTMGVLPTLQKIIGILFLFVGSFLMLF